MATFAEAEAQLRGVLRQATKLIRRCYEAHKKQVPPLLEAALPRMWVIATFRHDFGS
jgi:hypothetical protein